MSPIKFDTIVYHNPCNDGAVALWCANYFLPIEEKIAGRAGCNPQNLIPDNKNILFVDLCPPLDYLFNICKSSSQVVVIDHHKSTLDDWEQSQENKPANLTMILDMERSGCQMSWDYFFPNSLTRPWFVDYVGDRDLWAWKLPNSREINEYFFENYTLEPTKLDEITQLITWSPEQKNQIIQEGASILKYKKKQLDLASSRSIESVMRVNDFEYKVWLGTTTTADRSDLGNILANKLLSSGFLPDFSAVWVYEPKSNEWWISLRGHKNSPDLSVIAKQFGGGGHPKASGITIKAPKTLRDIFIIN
jgi:nanoRNase/pAp phosphatase (c-di-AMP/oligoRNAs hydrolase)